MTFQFLCISPPNKPNSSVSAFLFNYLLVALCYKIWRSINNFYENLSFTAVSIETVVLDLKLCVYCILFSLIVNECYRRFQNSLLCTEDTRLFILFNRKKQNIASY
jgi:hypothetical protein